MALVMHKVGQGTHNLADPVILVRLVQQAMRLIDVEHKDFRWEDVDQSFDQRPDLGNELLLAGDWRLNSCRAANCLIQRGAFFWILQVGIPAGWR